MRNVSLSTDVYAAIWAARQPGEDDETAILGRLLGVKAPPVEIQATGGGLDDARNGVHFREGFEIFRVFRGTRYRAKVTRGEWTLMNTGAKYPTVNALSSAIGAVENAWLGWRYRNNNGQVLYINALRPKQ